MIGLQDHQEGYIIITRLTKIFRLFLWKFARLEKTVLGQFFPHITRNGHYH